MKNDRFHQTGRCKKDTNSFNKKLPYFKTSNTFNKKVKCNKKIKTKIASTRSKNAT